MNQKYNYTLNSSFENAHYDCKIVADSIHDDESFQNADTGLVLGYMDRIIEALEKQVPKKPIYSRLYATTPDMNCSICGKTFLSKYPQDNFCTQCGQVIDWSEVNE